MASTNNFKLISAFAVGAVAGILFIKSQHKNNQNQLVEGEAGKHVSNNETKVVALRFEQNPDWVDVVKRPLSVEELIKAVETPKAGAIVTFSGVTRDNFDGKEVLRLEYEGFDEMGKKEMTKICNQIRNKWKVEHIAIVHRVGVCPIGEASVIIAVSSAHRREAIEATHYAIDTLKATVPIWKKEFYNEGSSNWKENKEWKSRGN